jgi:hypothetical protein
MLHAVLLLEFGDLIPKGGLLLCKSMVMSGQQ